MNGLLLIFLYQIQIMQSFLVEILATRNDAICCDGDIKDLQIQAHGRGLLINLFL